MRGNVQLISICTRCRQASDKTFLEHIGTTAGVLADYNTDRLVVAVVIAQCVI